MAITKDYQCKCLLLLQALSLKREPVITRGYSQIGGGKGGVNFCIRGTPLTEIESKWERVGESVRVSKREGVETELVKQGE